MFSVSSMKPGGNANMFFLCFQLERANHRNDFKYDVFPFKTWKRDSVSKEIHCERGSVSTKHDKMVGNAHV